MDDNLVDWLAPEIEQRGWSIRQLARQADISHTTISNVLSKQREPTWDFCAAIAQAFQISPIEVFHRACLLSPKPELDTTAEELLHLYHQLSEEQRKMALQTLRAWVSGSKG